MTLDRGNVDDAKNMQTTTWRAIVANMTIRVVAPILVGAAGLAGCQQQPAPVAATTGGLRHPGARLHLCPVAADRD